MSHESQNGDWSGRIAVTGIGMVTPVGLTADTAVASMRAGISRLAQLPYLEIEVDEGEYGPVIGASTPVIASSFDGNARLIEFAAHSVADAIAEARLANQTEVEIFVGTASEQRGGRVLTLSEELQGALFDSAPAGLLVRNVHIVAAGRAAGLKAIRMAAQSISSGRTAVAVAGGVDSWAQLRSLLWLRETDRLREFPRRTGILPGEASGFVVLESVEHATSRRSVIQAVLTAAAGRVDVTPEGEPCEGRALGSALGVVCRGVNDAHALVISDLNGERYRALEWALAVPKGMWRYETLRHWHPAEYMGDSGAASGMMSLGWAAKALFRGYAKTPRVLVWGASDEGGREALMLSEGQRL